MSNTYRKDRKGKAFKESLKKKDQMLTLNVDVIIVHE